MELPDTDAAGTAACCLTDDLRSARIAFRLGSVAGVVHLDTKSRPSAGAGSGRRSTGFEMLARSDSTRRVVVLSERV
ncbi:hypothetical protein [Streptomyces sp. SP18ES09]|uniref:hypothetical protein n=1 Tax=Streptomyces sp. SP18ES09 TaxID=3002532 RepID=UPI002E7635C4|nr:hypothetical protein [Streptomyces sp. SP18ES09]